MTFGSNVAPPKIPLRPKPEPWTCRCEVLRDSGGWSASTLGIVRPGYLARCLGCGMRRPQVPYSISKRAGGDTPASDAWMERCIRSVEKSGKDKKLALLVCKSQYQRMKSKKGT